MEFESEYILLLVEQIKHIPFMADILHTCHLTNSWSPLLAYISCPDAAECLTMDTPERKKKTEDSKVVNTLKIGEEMFVDVVSVDHVDVTPATQSIKKEEKKSETDKPSGRKRSGKKKGKPNTKKNLKKVIGITSCPDGTSVCLPLLKRRPTSAVKSLSIAATLAQS